MQKRCFWLYQECTQPTGTKFKQNWDNYFYKKITGLRRDNQECTGHRDTLAFEMLINKTRVFGLKNAKQHIYAQTLKLNQKALYLSRGGGQVVRVLAFNSDDPSSNPADV